MFSRQASKTRVGRLPGLRIETYEDETGRVLEVTYRAKVPPAETHGTRELAAKHPGVIAAKLVARP